MNKFSFFKQHVLIFRRWSRNPFAVFSSLSAQVKIAFIALNSTLLLGPNVGYAQQDTIKINNHLDVDEVVISSNRNPKVYSQVSRVVAVIPSEEIQQSPVQSLQELLNYAQGVDVRQRGAKGVQADVSVRGGSFEQTLILLNGIPVNDPQTGHHNLNLPIDIESIERVEILEGPGSRIFGPNAFTGAINIITNSNTDNRVKAFLSAGEYGFVNANASLNYTTGILNNFISFGNKQSSGYQNNTDFNSLQAFYRGNIATNAGNFDLQLGYLNKSFGANSFYTQAYPDQFEQIRNSFASLSHSFTKNNFTGKTRVYYRANQDRFELFRESDYNYANGFFVTQNADTAKYVPGNYEAWNYYPGHNYHITQVAGANFNLGYKSIIGTTSFGLDYKYEHIKSNVLGEDLDNPIDVPNEDRGQFTKSADRNHFNVYLEQDYNHNRFNVSAGLLMHVNNSYGTFYAAGGEMSYRFFKSGKVFASVNQAMRMPTFTDLYYSGPSNVGNPDLEPEQAISYELGYKHFGKYVYFGASGFYRDTENAIDWVKTVDEPVYTTTNYTQLQTQGVELSARLLTSNIDGLRKYINYFNANYSFLDMDKTEDAGFISGYSLDYLKHKLNITADHTIYRNLHLSWNMTFQDRNGTFTSIENGEEDYDPFFLMDLRLYYELTNWNFFIDAANVFDTDYADIGGLTQPGRWIVGGVKMNIEL